jgi:hypothetical protein
VDGVVTEVLQRQDRQGDLLLRLAVLVTALALVGSAQAATGQGTALAKQLLPTVAKFYKSKGSSDVFTKATCVLPTTANIGHCKVYFKNTAQGLTGWFNITASVNRSTGGVRWAAAKVTCKDSKTGTTVRC